MIFPYRERAEKDFPCLSHLFSKSFSFLQAGNVLQSFQVQVLRQTFKMNFK